jgi:hypothetical protein
MKIKNWEKFQHYKDRNPPWIKLHNELQNDPDWHELSGDAAKLLINLWMIASDYSTDGSLPDSRKLAFRLRTDVKTLEKLIRQLSHWLEHDASEALAECLQDACPETETETETEGKAEAKREAERETNALRAEFAEQFWPLYPHKVGKPDALKAFFSIRKHSSLSEILHGLTAYIAAKPPDRNWLNPATFLRQERFRDVPALPVQPAPRLSRTQQAISEIMEEIVDHGNVIDFSRPRICGPGGGVVGVELSAAAARSEDLHQATDRPLHGEVMRDLEADG